MKLNEIVCHDGCILNDGVQGGKVAQFSAAERWVLTTMMKLHTG